MKSKPKLKIRKVKHGGWTWRVREELTPQLSEIAAAVLSLPDDKRAQKVKVTGGRRGIWKVRLEALGATAFVKHYSAPRFSKRLKHLIRNSRTRQEWEMGVRLERLNLPVARHLAMAERKETGLLQEDYLVEEALEGYQNFDAWHREQWEGARSGEEVKKRRAVIARLAALIRRMHDLGVLQRDFKPDSIMVGPEGDFKLVDLERALISRRPRGLSLRARLDNLAKIDQTFGFVGSSTDRLRFLHAYFEGRAEKDKIHEHARWISERAEWKFRKRARERRVWTEERNETYDLFEAGGFKVVAHRSLDRKFMTDFIERLKRGTSQGLLPYPGPGHENEKLAALWCDARIALAHTPSLYYRKAPFIPARAAVCPTAERFSLLLSLVPGPPLLDWTRALALARDQGRELEFAADLGRALRIFHRMGVTLNEFSHDAMLCDPGHPDRRLRFYLNRLDLVHLDRTPGEREAMRILTTVSDRLGLSGKARAVLVEAYQRSGLRWFCAPDRW